MDNSTDTEDLKMLGLILDRLIGFSKSDISAFRCSKYDGWNEYDSGLVDEFRDTIWYRKRSKVFEIMWNPINNSWKPEEYEFKGYIKLEYCF